MVADFAKKRKEAGFSKKTKARALAVLFILAAIALILADSHMWRRRRDLMSKIEFYEKQIEDLKKSNENLKSDIANADNVEYLEKIAYEELGEQKPGEQGVIFVMPDKKSEENVSQKNLWTSWISNAWNWIKSNF